MAAGVLKTIPSVGEGLGKLAKILGSFQVIIGIIAIVLGIMGLSGLQAIAAIIAGIILLSGIIGMLPIVGSSLEKTLKNLGVIQIVIGIAAIAIGIWSLIEFFLFFIL